MTHSLRSAYEFLSRGVTCPSCVLQKQIITIIMSIKIIGTDYLANVSSHATVYQVMRRKKVSCTTLIWKYKYISYMLHSICIHIPHTLQWWGDIDGHNIWHEYTSIDVHLCNREPRKWKGNRWIKKEVWLINPIWAVLNQKLEGFLFIPTLIVILQLTSFALSSGNWFL